jgi:NAD(P)-dependent dehydrogenase (short-subunit alcohol dehydrogenase family)
MSTNVGSGAVPAGSAMTRSLEDNAVLVIGRGSGLAYAIVRAVAAAGAHVVAAGRQQEALAAAYAGEQGITTEMVALLDEASIAAWASGWAASTTWSPPRPRGPAVVWRTWTATRSGSPSTPR